MSGRSKSIVKKRHLPGEATTTSPKIPPSNSVIARILQWGPCALALLIYTPALKFGFIYDDHKQIVENPQVHSWAYLPEIFTTHLWSQTLTYGFYYRPLFTLWLVIVHTVGDLSPWIWHLFSAVLHAVATYLVLKLCLDMLGSLVAASYSALLFAIHPIHIESVCWISASDELLYTVFVLASLLLFVQSLRTPNGAELRMTLSAGAFAGALFSKETAIAVLPLYFFLAYKSTSSSTHQRTRRWRMLRLGAPFVIVALVYLAVRSMVLERSGLETGPLSWHQVLFTSPSVVVFYIRKLLWPVGLSGFYWNPVLSAPNVGMWFTMLFILGGILAFTWISFRREPLIGLAEGLLVLPLFPVLAGLRSFSLYGLAHDRYLYLPSVGACLLIGLLVKALWGGGSRTRIAVGVAGSCLILTFVWLNLTQQNFYLDDDRFYQRAVDIAPRDARVRDLWGDFCFSQKRLTRAIELFSQAHEIEPDNPMVTGYLVKGLFANQEYAAAKPYLEDLVQDTRVQGDQHFEFMVALAQVQIELGHLSAAERVLDQARNEGASHPGLHFTLGTLYQREGKIPEAQSEYAQEYQVSGNVIAGQRAMELERQMRSNSAHSPSQDSSGSVPKK